jgi:hypothetical protein
MLKRDKYDLFNSVINDFFLKLPDKGQTDEKKNDIFKCLFSFTNDLLIIVYKKKQLKQLKPQMIQIHLDLDYLSSASYVFH